MQHLFAERCSSSFRKILVFKMLVFFPLELTTKLATQVCVGIVGFILEFFFGVRAMRSVLVLHMLRGNSTVFKNKLDDYTRTNLSGVLFDRNVSWSRRNVQIVSDFVEINPKH